MILKGTTLFYFLALAIVSFGQSPTSIRMVPLEMANIRFEDSYIKVTYPSALELDFYSGQQAPLQQATGYR